MAIKSNKQFKTITPQGKEFIIYYSNLKDRLSGFYKYSMKDGGPRAFDRVTANITDQNNEKITNGDQYANALIKWYNQYGDEFNINPNVLAAQGWQESGQYAAYAYTKTTTAMGISQFTVDTIFTIVISDFYNTFTDEEVSKITNGITPIEGHDEIWLKNYFIVKPNAARDNSPSTNAESDLVLANKPILYQNVINNPDIMIKAQAVYLRGISDFNANLAASALSFYYAGPLIYKGREDRIIRTEVGNGKGTDNYGSVIDELNSNPKYGASRLHEAVEYSRTIFDLLGNNHLFTNGRGFGFNLNFNKIVGADFKDSSISQPLRVTRT